jgi:hypothetical protein
MTLLYHMKVAILRLLSNWLSRCRCEKPHIKIQWTISMGQWLSYIFYLFVKMELLVQNFRITVTISYPNHTKRKEISYDTLLKNTLKNTKTKSPEEMLLQFDKYSKWLLLFAAGIELHVHLSRDSALLLIRTKV